MDIYDKMAEFLIKDYDQNRPTCDFCKAIDANGNNLCCDDEKWCVKGTAIYLRDRQVLKLDNILKKDSRTITYLIAKKHAEPGCMAVRTEGGEALAHLVAYLGIKTLDRGVQILTVSDPEIYGEYKPYEFVESEKEFISRVLEY